MSDGWRKYFGFRIPAEKIDCEGCRTDTPVLIDAECPVRPCVLQKGLEHCAECGEYICEKLRGRIVDRAELEKKRGEGIPEEDYLCFIRPYENFLRLEELRNNRSTCQDRSLP
ncbi:MAG: DUF3795 domain-containing protein [Anaerolineales bacterium]|nr:DUF3795 domain-containing protein [Anaerolineales bacterium]